jgi:hypothetical protein
MMDDILVDIDIGPGAWCSEVLAPRVIEAATLALSQKQQRMRLCSLVVAIQAKDALKEEGEVRNSPVAPAVECNHCPVF